MAPHHYRIIVSGPLGEFTRQVFEDLCVESDGANTGLSGELDQAGLFGVLARIMEFGLELVALSRLDDESRGRTDDTALPSSQGLAIAFERGLALPPRSGPLPGLRVTTRPGQAEIDAGRPSPVGRATPQ
jgi:hypothetical protein